MKKLYTKLVAFVLALAMMTMFASCGYYEVSLGIGDGNKENDRVSADYTLPEKMDGTYRMKVTFSAKSEADTTRTFTFGITFDDPLFSDSYTETVLFKLDGADVKDGTTIKADIELSAALFGETDVETPVWIVFHNEDMSTRQNVTEWASSKYEYTRNGDTVVFAKN